MTKKKEHPYKQDAEDALEAEEQTQPEIEALQDQLEETKTKLAESVQGWQRAQADFQNYKKRIERDNELMYASMKSDIIKKILPVLDDLERAIQNRPADDAWGLGVDLILRKFQNILQAEGIKRIEATGAEFDPNFHEAISHEPNDEVESHHVIEVVQNGYTLGERVIRPALVRVAQ